MNFLHDIFLETFGDKYYFSKTGRAYVEYIGGPSEKFNGKICFFHFSHSNINLNSLHNFEILKFIRLFYSSSYEELLPLMKYAIEKKFVMSMNSLDEYNFIIKFWNEDEIIRSLFTNYIIDKTGCCFQLEQDEDIRFFEMQINTKKETSIEKIIVYSEKDLIKNIEYIDTYIESQNIFMTLQMKKYSISDSFLNTDTGILIKLKEPICFSQSEYIMNNLYPKMEIPFSPEDLYVGFIEQGCSDNNLYYTYNYSIPA